MYKKTIPINNYHLFISVKGFLPNSHTHKSQIRELTRHDVISMNRRKSVCWVKDILTRDEYIDTFKLMASCHFQLSYTMTCCQSNWAEDEHRVIRRDRVKIYGKSITREIG